MPAASSAGAGGRRHARQCTEATGGQWTRWDARACRRASVAEEVPGDVAHDRVDEAQRRGGVVDPQARRSIGGFRKEEVGAGTVAAGGREADRLGRWRGRRRGAGRRRRARAWARARRGRRGRGGGRLRRCLWARGGGRARGRLGRGLGGRLWRWLRCGLWGWRRRGRRTAALVGEQDRPHLLAGRALVGADADDFQRSLMMLPGGRASP